MPDATKIVNVLWLKDSAGKTHRLQGRKFASLVRELKAGRGGPEVCNLIESGYETFDHPEHGPTPLDSICGEMFA